MIEPHYALEMIYLAGGFIMGGLSVLVILGIGLMVDKYERKKKND
jgi:hypothetical protein